MSTFNCTDYKDGLGSEAVYGLYYDSVTNRLGVEFWDSEGIYVYPGTKADYDDILRSGSIGRAVSQFRKRAGRATWFDTFFPRQAIGEKGGRGVSVASQTAAPSDTPASVEDYLPLGVKSETQDKAVRNHTVVFIVEGTDTEAQFNVPASSVDAAVEALYKHAKALSLTLKVKEVITHF